MLGAYRYRTQGFPIASTLRWAHGWPTVCLKDTEQGGVVFKSSRTDIVGLLGKVDFVIELAPCLDAHEKLEFFHSLSITSIFGPMHEVVKVKIITNYTV
jgi:hypothetical protein